MGRLSASFLLALLLAACQSSVTASVTRFNSLATVPNAKSFTILPEKEQQGSLEFDHFAQLVADQLSTRGFAPVAPSGPPTDLVVFMHYGSGGARTQVIDYGPARPGWGWGGWGWGAYYPPYPAYDVYTLYAKFVEIQICDGPAWRAGRRESVFQGRAVAETGTPEINVVMPYLIRALFDNFPGANGQTVKVTVPVS